MRQCWIIQWSWTFSFTNTNTERTDGLKRVHFKNAEDVRFHRDNMSFVWTFIGTCDLQQSSTKDSFFYWFIDLKSDQTFNKLIIFVWEQNESLGGSWCYHSVNLSYLILWHTRIKMLTKAKHDCQSKARRSNPERPETRRTEWAKKHQRTKPFSVPADV